MEARYGDTLGQKHANLQGRGQPRWSTESQGQLGYTLRSCLKRKENRKRPEILQRVICQYDFWTHTHTRTLTADSGSEALYNQRDELLN